MPRLLTSSTTLRRAAGTLCTALAALLLAAGCGGPGDEAPDAAAADAAVAEEETGEALAFETLGAGQRGTLTDTTEAVFREPAPWAALQDSLHPMAPFEDVDFSQMMVLVAALPQANSGYSIDFTSVESTDGGVVAAYVVNAPGEDCLTAAALTVPFAAVAVRRVGGPVRFERSVEEYSCAVRQR